VIEADYYNKEYWYDNPEEHSDVDNYGENYYAYQIYEKMILNLDIPEEGYIVLMGTNRCVSFDLLCNYFGNDRCIGFDIHNPENHPRVVVKDCMTLSEVDDLPIAFCHNDLGSFPTTPELKIYGQKWAARNIIKGGYFLGRNNLNVAKFKSEELMEGLGFENTHFKDLEHKYDMSTFEPSWIEGHMLSRRVK
jgi:hypothetical protein|tara:strand:- start:718 stop:1293 length:576 start_codon:yes stop_codon:yes gene_type:complete